MLTLARTAVAKTGCRNLCLAGGVALNSKANGKILASGIVDGIFVQPASGDDGVCLGAALAPYLDAGGRLPVRKMRHAYLGTEKLRWRDREGITNIQAPVDASGRPGPCGKPKCSPTEKSSAGFRGAWNSARAHWATVRFSPTHETRRMNAKVNNAVKFREWWRPFAPSLLAEVAGEYLESATDSPFMVLTAQVRPEKRSIINRRSLTWTAVRGHRP